MRCLRLLLLLLTKPITTQCIHLNPSYSTVNPLRAQIINIISCCFAHGASAIRIMMLLLFETKLLTTLRPKHLSGAGFIFVCVRSERGPHKPLRNTARLVCPL